MEHEIFIAGEGARIAIAVHGYQSSDAADGESTRWLSCTVSGHAGGFHASTELSIRSVELRALGELFSAAAIADHELHPFDAMEQGLRLDFRRSRSGRLALECVIRRTSRPRAHLDFFIDTDIASVERAAQQVARARRDLVDSGVG